MDKTTFGVLGRTALRIAGTLEEGWGRPKERAVLAALLIHVGRPVSIDALMEWVWPEDVPCPRNPVPTFHTYATRIRRSLERVGPAVGLAGERRSYRLDADSSAIDLFRFRSLISDARAQQRLGQIKQASATALRAIGLWRGRPLDELCTDRADNWRRRVQDDEWIPANRMLLETLIELGELDDVLARLDDLQADHPGNIGLASLRMTALHGLTRTSDAAAYYFGTRKQLLADGDERAADYIRLVHEKLSAEPHKPEAQPIRAESIVVPRQLPHDVNDFVGRRQLLETLDTTMTGSGGVVVIDGMAGVGKSALAVHWARRRREWFPDGDLYINLNGFSADPTVEQSTVVDTFLAALGHEMDAKTSTRARQMRLSNLLVGRRMLVLLDNACDSEQVAGLIPLLSSCQVIVTSRQQLTRLSTWHGARRLLVEPMSGNEAAALLGARLGTRVPATGTALADLARLCGGLPLVITIVADRMATRPGAELSAFVDQLRRDQPMLEIGADGDATASLETVFSWSYLALRDPERRLFRLLGLHPGADIGLPAAIAGDGRTPAETRRSLSALVGAHLLTQPRELDRYSTHDLVREFALQVATTEASAEERRAAERRYLTFYLASAGNAERQIFPAHCRLSDLPVEDGVQPLEFADEQQATEWCVRERTNLDAAVQYAATNGHDDVAGRLPHAVSAIYRRLGFVELAREALRVAVAAARATSDWEAEAASLQQLGMVHLVLGDYPESRRCLDSALRLTEDAQNANGQAYTLHTLARLEVLEDNAATGVDLYRKCLEVARTTSNLDIQCWSHYRLGETLRGMAQYDLAQLHLHQAQWLTDQVGDASAKASILTALGALFADRGEYVTAEAYCRQALGIVMRIRYTAVGGWACTVLAEISRDRGDDVDAREYARRAVSLYHRIHNFEGEARALDVLAGIHLRLGNHAAAIEGWTRSRDLYSDLGKSAKVELVGTKLSELENATPAVPEARSTDHHREPTRRPLG